MTETKLFVLTVHEDIFRKFDLGEEISQKMPKSCKIKKGETVEWKFKHFSGRARVGLCFQLGEHMMCHFTKVE